MQPKENLIELRKLMKARGLDAWIVPSADPHQSEYVAAHWQARAWLSGFRGSAGTVVVTSERAGLWTDQRYHLRAAAELAGSGIERFTLGLPGTPAMLDWLIQELPRGSLVGFDGSVISAAEAANLEQGLAEKGIATTHQYDLIAELWHDRPPLPLNPIFLLADSFSGESRALKLERIRAGMQSLGAQLHLLTGLDDIAWTMNLRGSDIDYNPLAVCYALVTLQASHLFIEPEKVPGQVRQALEGDGVILHAYSEIDAHLQRLPAGNAILIDPEKTNVRLRGCIPAECRVIESQSLPFGMKTVKNATELEGIRRMHRRDGAALVRWMCWLDQNLAAGQQTEVSAAEKLEEFRNQAEHYRGPSFHTIAGYAANSAVGHYQSDPLTAPSLEPRGIFLIDSGGQYLDGTSDITRTLSLGQPSAKQKLAFTTVLKCHIRLASARFPKGTKGMQLDALAREPLWRQGWNCRHGIGHGVGCFLNVHEGPPRFNEVNTTALEAGMLLSNEPGVYFEGNFGVRIENLLIVVPADPTAFGEFLGFETVSLCPIDLELVEPALLEPAEIAWLNSYHRRVRESLAGLLDENDAAWLKHETRDIRA